LAQRRKLLVQFAVGKVGRQDGGIGDAGDEGVEHDRAGDAEQVAGDQEFRRV
jgi:hypothetical protein